MGSARADCSVAWGVDGTPLLPCLRRIRTKRREAPGTAAAGDRNRAHGDGAAVEGHGVEEGSAGDRTPTNQTHEGTGAAEAGDGPDAHVLGTHSGWAAGGSGAEIPPPWPCRDPQALLPPLVRLRLGWCFPRVGGLPPCPRELLSGPSWSRSFLQLLLLLLLQEQPQQSQEETRQRHP